MKPNGTKAVVRKNASEWRYVSVTKQFFTKEKAKHDDKFANTFISKCNFAHLWPCLGLVYKGQLAGAIGWRITKRRPYTANLEILITFSKYRRLGVATKLCNKFLEKVQAAEYWRVSSEPEAVPFYESLGVVFLGRQKSGCLLAVGRLATTFEGCNYDLEDEVIQAKVQRKGRGGCVEVFKVGANKKPSD